MNQKSAREIAEEIVNLLKQPRFMVDFSRNLTISDEFLLNEFKPFIESVIQAERQRCEGLREACIKAVQDEPEYPGEMPKEMFDALLELAKNKDKGALEEWHRLGVRLTKTSIEERIKSISPTSAVESENENYRANFLWPVAEGSIEKLFYEFANGKTEAYQKEMYEAILEHLNPHRVVAEKCEHEVSGGWRMDGEPFMTQTEGRNVCPFCPRKEKPQEPNFQDRLRKFVSDQKDCPPEFMRVVNKEFWNLFADETGSAGTAEKCKNCNGDREVDSGGFTPHGMGEDCMWCTPKTKTKEPNPKHIIFNGRVYGLLEEGRYTMKNPVQVVEKGKEPSLLERMAEVLEYANEFLSPLLPLIKDLLQDAKRIYCPEKGWPPHIESAMRILDGDSDEKSTVADIEKLLAEYEQTKEKQ